MSKLFPKPQFVVVLFSSALLFVALLTGRMDLLFMSALAGCVWVLMSPGDGK